MSSRLGSFAPAYDACLALAHTHYENFPVASRLLPAFMRPHVAAVYAFARVADDIADEGTDPPAARRTRLAAWQARLHEAVGDASIDRALGSRDALITAATGQSIRPLDLPLSLFRRPGQRRFGQDITAYALVADVHDFAARPPIRLVGSPASPLSVTSTRRSDALVQRAALTNFWRLLGRLRAGRLYVPAGRPARAGASSRPRRRPLVARGRRRWRSASRRRARVRAAVTSCNDVRGRLQLRAPMTQARRTRILDRVEHARTELLHHRPTPAAADVPALLCAARWERRCSMARKTSFTIRFSSRLRTSARAIIAVWDSARVDDAVD